MKIYVFKKHLIYKNKLYLLMYAGPIKDQMLLIIVDFHTKWIEIHAMSATGTIESLKVTFAQLGLPKTEVTDNGPAFVSRVKRLPKEQWDYPHYISLKSPWYQRSCRTSSSDY